MHPHHFLIQIDVGSEIRDQASNTGETFLERLPDGALENLRRRPARINTPAAQVFYKRKRAMVGAEHDKRFGQSDARLDFLEELFQRCVESQQLIHDLLALWSISVPDD